MFLFIFFAKMVISVAPMITVQFDSDVVNAVIMQLEIENHSTKGADQVKDSLHKGEWLCGLSRFKLFWNSTPNKLNFFSANNYYRI